MSSELITLFTSAFISSTIFPGGSEALLIYLLTQTDLPHFQLWMAASSGNTLGGISSYLLGFILISLFPTTTFIQKHKNAVEQIRKHGGWLLFLSWLPVVGDPLCIAAGWVRVHWLFAF